jgi:hypothetical protein
MARPTSTTNHRRRANAAHSVTRRVLPCPASPVISANPPVLDSARSRRSASRISSGCRPTIVMHGVSQSAIVHALNRAVRPIRPNRFLSVRSSGKLMQPTFTQVAHGLHR